MVIIQLHRCTLWLQRWLPHYPSVVKLFHVKACCHPFLELVITDYNNSDYETPLYYWSSHSAVRNQGM